MGNTTRSRLLALVTATSLLGAPAVAQELAAPGGSRLKPGHDVRVPAGDAAVDFRLRLPTPLQAAAARALELRLPGVVLRWDPLAASPRWLAAPPGRALSNPSPLDPEAAARAFVRARADLFGLAPAQVDELTLTSRLPAPGGGTHLYFNQTVGGIDVHGGRLNLTLRGDGAVLHLGSQLYAGLQPAGRPSVDAVSAVRLAALNVYPDRLVTGDVVTADRPDRRTTVDGPEFGRSPMAWLVLFPEADGARLAWEVRLAEPGLRSDYRVLIDAAGGAVLTRHDLKRDHGSRGAGLAIPASTPESLGWFQSPEGAGCFTTLQAQIVDSGYSDLFTASYLDDPSYGEELGLSQAAIRDMRQDLRYGDLCDIGVFCTFYEPMIWAGTLWDLRRSMIAFDPVGGLDDFHTLMIESQASTPCEPTLLDGRDAVLAADTLLFGSMHHAFIWNAFAAREMGELAATTGPDDQNPTADTTVPVAFVCSPPPTPGGPSAATDGDNAVRLDYAAAGAATVEIWREDLDNPSDAPELVGTTADLSSYSDTTVQGGKNYRYHLVALGAAGSGCRSGVSTTADAVATGACDLEFPLFIPELSIADGNPDCSVTLQWTPADEACPGSGEPIVYNVYRWKTPGYAPAEAFLLSRTTDTSFVDTPPDFTDSGGIAFDHAPYYLVTAEHGTLNDPPDHRGRGSAQAMDWEPGIPTLGRTTTHSWDFDDGPQGWTTDDNGFPDPASEWTLVDPSPTWFGGALQAPDEPAGGSGLAWVTGDGGPSTASIISNACGYDLRLLSPRWDGTDGSTIVSFDYWSSESHRFAGNDRGLWICVPGTSGFCAREFGLQAFQSYAGPGRYGWQRAEIDLSRLVTPTTSMGLLFAGNWCDAYDEYGIDNVRIERGTVCPRSKLDLSSVTVDDSGPGHGNGNGALEPGEIVRLDLELVNDGSGTAVAPTATLRATTPDVYVLDDSASFLDIAPGANGENIGDGFLVAFPGGASCRGEVTFELTFKDAAGMQSTGQVWTTEYGIGVDETVLADDFSTDQGWTASGALPQQGQWERADPSGTFDGSNPPANPQANPEDDSPNDADTMCYVTGNRGFGSATLDDVDPGAQPVLTSPLLDISPYKRLSVTYDHWYYGPSSPFCDNYEDRSECSVSREDAWLVLWCSDSDYCPTAGWETESYTRLLDPAETDPVRLAFTAIDDGADDVVEVGVDNVFVVGERRVCLTSGLNPPNPVGNTLAVDKVAGDAQLSWTAPPVDGAHDAAVFYPVWISAAPDSGFAVAATPTTETTNRSPTSATEFYLVEAVNGGGSSGEDPN